MAILNRYSGLRWLSVWLIILIAGAILASDGTNGAEMRTEQQCVVLLHGMGRTRFSMSHLEGELTEKGLARYR